MVIDVIEMDLIPSTLGLQKHHLSLWQLLSFRQVGVRQGFKFIPRSPVSLTLLALLWCFLPDIDKLTKTTSAVALCNLLIQSYQNITKMQEVAIHKYHNQKKSSWKQCILSCQCSVYSIWSLLDGCFKIQLLFFLVQTSHLHSSLSTGSLSFSTNLKNM